MRRIVVSLSFIILIIFAAFFVFGPAIIERRINKIVPFDALVLPKAQSLHQSLVIADLHSDTLLWKRSILNRADHGHVDLPRLLEGNVALQVFSSVSKTPKNLNFNENSSDTDNITLLAIAQLQPPRTWTSLLERSLFHARKLEDAALESNGRLRLIKSRNDLGQLMLERQNGKQVTGALFSVEGLHNLEGNIANLKKLQDAGMRMAGLVHFFDNEIAGSMHGIKKGGLSDLGRKVVSELEALNIIIDLAHASHASVSEVLSIATKPVVSSHGGVQATCKNNRNLSDKEIQGIAKTGGIVGIGYFHGAVCGRSPAQIVKAIRHVRDLVGINHVALGSDFDGGVTTGFDTSQLSLITQAMLDAGFDENEIRKVMGGNVIRILEQVL